MLKLIVVPLDGSALAENAVPFAVRLAGGAGAELLLVRAAFTPSAAVVTNASAARIAAAHQATVLVSAEAELKAVAERLRAEGIAVRTHARVGNPLRVILEAARSHDADLIAMSTHGRSGLGRYLYGSVADEVVRHAQTPLLLVPPGCEAPWRTDQQLRVLVALDGSRLAEEALEPASMVSEALGADLLLLRVVLPADAGLLEEAQTLDARTAQEIEHASRYLTALAEPLRTGSCAVGARAVAGAPASGITRMAREEGADLIAMATHGRGGLARIVLGSVATGVLRRATVPLLVVRPAALPAAPPLGAGADRPRRMAPADVD